MHRIDPHVLLPRSTYGRNFIPAGIAANPVFSVTPIPLDQTVVGGGAPIWHFRGDKQGSATTGSHAAQPGGGGGAGKPRTRAG